MNKEVIIDLLKSGDPTNLNLVAQLFKSMPSNEIWDVLVDLHDGYYYVFHPSKNSLTGRKMLFNYNYLYHIFTFSYFNPIEEYKKPTKTFKKRIITSFESEDCYIIFSI